MPPVLFIKSALRQAEAHGIGDGTSYGQATGATPTQSGKTFVLTSLTFITDIGADADDKFNGRILYFPASGNKYHLVDWVASTNTATVWEVPQTTDTGACEIRRALVDNKALAGSPTHRLADGQKFSKWKSGANATIDVYLPNFIDNGGFESAAIAPWVKSFSGGTADTSGRNAVSPILGGADYTLDRGDRTQVNITQPIRYPLEPGKTYQILFKGRFTTSMPQDSLEINIIDELGNTTIPATYSSQTSGTVNANTWKPLLTASNIWHSVDFKVQAEGIPAGSRLAIFVVNSADIANLDEIYLYEKINVNSLLIFDHKSGEQYGSIFGRRCASDRTGFTVAVDDSELVSGTTTLTGKNTHLKEFTGGAFPVYSIVGISLKEASEILLSEKWALPFERQLPVRPNLKKRNQSIFTARSGVETRTTHFTRSIRSGTFRAVPAADLSIYLNDWIPNHFDDDYPFAVRWATGETPMLMINDDTEAGETFPDLHANWNFKFKEVF